MPQAVQNDQEELVDRASFRAFQTSVHDRFDLVLEELRAGSRADTDRHRTTIGLGWLWFTIGAAIGVAGLWLAISATATSPSLSPEDRLIDRAEQRWLPEPLTPGEQQEWVGEIAKQGPDALLFMVGHEASVGTTPTTQAERREFVEDLYFVFQERDAQQIDPGGFAYWLGKLESGQQPREVATEFLSAG